MYVKKIRLILSWLLFSFYSISSYAHLTENKHSALSHLEHSAWSLSDLLIMGGLFTAAIFTVFYCVSKYKTVSKKSIKK